MPPPTRRDWFRRNWLSMLLFIPIGSVWAGAIEFYSTRMMGITITSINGRPATLVDEIIIRSEVSVIFTAFACLVGFAFLYVFRARFRGWLAVLLLFTIGTPIGLLTLSPIGLATAGLLLLLIEQGWRVFTERRARHLETIPCPKCAYSLRGNMTGSCPECGSAVEADGIPAAS